MRRVAIVGPGALGMLLAAALHPVADVCLVGRRPAWAEAVARHGITCHGWPPHPANTGRRSRAFRVRAVVGGSAAGRVDLAIVVVKSGQTEAAIPALQQLVANGAQAVLSLQNGLGHVAALAAAIGWDRLILGTCTYGVIRLDDTVCQVAGEGDIVLGSRPAAAAWPDVMALLQRAGLRVSAAPDTLAAVWLKALINVGINPLTALLGVPNGAINEVATLRGLASEAVREGAAVAAAHGVDLPGDAVAAMLDVAARTAANRSSMLQDITAGRRTEIDAICGEIVRLGQAAGVATPINEALLTLIRVREEHNQHG